MYILCIELKLLYMVKSSSFIALCLGPLKANLYSVILRKKTQVSIAVQSSPFIVLCFGSFKSYIENQDEATKEYKANITLVYPYCILSA